MSGAGAAQHNSNHVQRNARWIMFHEAAGVTSDPSDRRQGERSEDVLLAGLLAGTQAYIHTGQSPESSGALPAKV